LKREGENLHYDLYISFAEAVLGISKDIEAINGKVRIKLEEGIQSGKILRLKGKGIPSINGYGNGDLLVHKMFGRQNTKQGTKQFSKEPKW
jgi:molecular chaperone DnaJ